MKFPILRQDNFNQLSNITKIPKKRIILILELKVRMWFTCDHLSHKRAASRQCRCYDIVDKDKIKKKSEKEN